MNAADYLAEFARQLDVTEETDPRALLFAEYLRDVRKLVRVGKAAGWSYAYAFGRQKTLFLESHITAAALPLFLAVFAWVWFGEPEAV